MAGQEYQNQQPTFEQPRTLNFGPVTRLETGQGYREFTREAAAMLLLRLDIPPSRERIDVTRTTPQL
jgi:hypothetical protein